MWSLLNKIKHRPTEYSAVSPAQHLTLFNQYSLAWPLSPALHIPTSLSIPLSLLFTYLTPDFYFTYRHAQLHFANHIFWNKPLFQDWIHTSHTHTTPILLWAHFSMYELIFKLILLVLTPKYLAPDRGLTSYVLNYYTNNTLITTYLI